MNHYDDLQRFKEKTRTQSLDFKDLSSHAAARETGRLGYSQSALSWGRKRILAGHGRIGIVTDTAAGPDGYVSLGRGRIRAHAATNVTCSPGSGHATPCLRFSAT